VGKGTPRHDEPKKEPAKDTPDSSCDERCIKPEKRERESVNQCLMKPRSSASDDARKNRANDDGAPS
jgi:hypothetical protein